MFGTQRRAIELPNMMRLRSLTALAALLAASLVMPGTLPEHLLLPPFEPEWAAARSTMIQTCSTKEDSPLAYLRDYGIVSYDWSNMVSTWHKDSPNDCDVKMVDQAARAKRAAPKTRIWIYRNLAQAYAEFQQVREKLEDPAYAGWFIKFGPNASSETPRCSVNPRSGKTLCSDLFHWRGQRPGGDCGDKIPCGWYLWDHRNESLRDWLINEHILGRRFGLRNESVDGFLIDDWWTLDGPSEVKGFFSGTNWPHNGAEIKAVYDAWSETTFQALAAIKQQGGFTWNGVNCELDKTGGYGGASQDMARCGLVKTEGYPHADNVKGTPTRPLTLSSMQKQCASWHRHACTAESILPKVPLLISWTRNNDRRQFPLPSPVHDVASFLLVRGPYAWLGYGWLGCTSDYERPAVLDYDFGQPIDAHCTEISDGVFHRKWSNAEVMLDCNTWTPALIVNGTPVPVPGPPPLPPTPPPPPTPPAQDCPAKDQIDGYHCLQHRCATNDPSKMAGGCGSDLCWPSVQQPNLCAPLPLPLESAAKEAAARCSAYQLCTNFAIYTDVASWRSSTCVPIAGNQTCAKFFTTGESGLNPVKDGWWSWVKSSAKPFAV